MTEMLSQPPRPPVQEEEIPDHKELAARKSLEFMENVIRNNPDIYALPHDADETTCTRKVMDNILGHEENQLTQKWGNRTYARCVRSLAWVGFFAVGGASLAVLPTIPMLTGVAAFANMCLFIKHLYQEELLAEAVKNQEEFEVRRLLAEGVNPNCPVHRSYGKIITEEHPMLAPFKNTSDKIAHILLTHNFNPNISSPYQYALSPLQSAIANMDKKRLTILLQHNAKVGTFMTSGSLISTCCFITRRR